MTTPGDKNFKAIAAMSQNRVIGRGDRIPWHLPEDFRWFKRVTMGQVLVMGRKTFQSIGKALPGRKTIVLSRRGFAHPDVVTVSELAEVDFHRGKQDVFICGGAEVYAAALPFCSDLYLTVVQREVEGDVFFPPFEHLFGEGEKVAEYPEFVIYHYRARTQT